MLQTEYEGGWVGRMREYEGRRKGRQERHLILYEKHWLPAVKMIGIVLTVSSDHILWETLTARKSKWTPPEGQFASPSTIGRLVSLEEIDRGISVFAKSQEE